MRVTRQQLPEASVQGMLDMMGTATPFIRAVLGEESGLDEVTQIVVGRGLRGIITDVLTRGDPNEYAETIGYMALENPAFVFNYLAARVVRGDPETEVSDEWKRIKRPIGFAIQHAKAGPT